MQIYPNSVGEYNADGTTKTEAEVCALTGIPVLEQHHITQRLATGSPYFIRVISQQYKNLTDDLKAELLASVTPKSAKKSSVDKSAADGAQKE